MHGHNSIIMISIILLHTYEMSTDAVTITVTDIVGVAVGWSQSHFLFTVYIKFLPVNVWKITTSVVLPRGGGGGGNPVCSLHCVHLP